MSFRFSRKHFKSHSFADVVESRCIFTASIFYVSKWWTRTRLFMSNLICCDVQPHANKYNLFHPGGPWNTTRAISQRLPTVSRSTKSSSDTIRVDIKQVKIKSFHMAKAKRKMKLVEYFWIDCGLVIWMQWFLLFEVPFIVESMVVCFSRMCGAVSGCFFNMNIAQELTFYSQDSR